MSLKSSMLCNSISRGLVAIGVGVLIAGCDQTTAPPSGEDLAGLGPLAAKSSGPPTAVLLASGLEGSLGSAVGPDGALYVAEAAAGRVARVDPQSGVVTTFASGLPTNVIAGGGPFDVAFIGNTAYALVTGVAPDVGGSDVNGIYRVDGPTSFTVVADIGEFNYLNPPTRVFPIDALSGFQYALEPYHGGFLVTDGHLNRVLRVTLDGDVTEMIAFGDIVPTGLAVWGNTVYLAEAGPAPHLPADGKVVSFGPTFPTATEVASGAPLAVDVEFGRGRKLYVLSQGDFPNGDPPGSPALPNTGALWEVNTDGTLSLITDELNQPTSVEFIGNTAYVVTLGGEIWKIEDVSDPPFGR